LALGLLASAGAASPAPTPQLAPRFHAEELGMAFDKVDPGILGLDGAFSLPEGAGRSLWIFGDTLLGRTDAKGRRQIADMPSNTAAFVNDAAWPQGFPQAAFVGGKRPEAVLRAVPSKGRGRFWPLDPLRVGARRWLYWVEIAAVGQGPLDFKVVGTGVAPETPPGSLRFLAGKPLWAGTAPSFGASALVHDGWLYCFAGGGETHLARVRPEQLDDPAAYRYWAGGERWSPQVAEAAALPGSGPEVSVRYNAYLHAFVMVYVPPFGATVQVRFAPAPWGPWGPARDVIACSPKGLPGAMFYGAKQHDELAEAGGQRLAITYNTNGPAELLDGHPELYWPRRVRLSFE
jgi:hypothetical protein